MTMPLSEFGIEHNPATGKKLLRFSNQVINRGEGPLEVIPVTTATSGMNGTTDAYQQIYSQDANGNLQVVSKKYVGTFAFHPPHDHWHFGNFARYELRNVAADGAIGKNIYAAAEKVSFCLGDNIPSNPDWPKTVSQTYTNCMRMEPQGISPGWIDSYPWWLPDQYLDITGLPDGEYWLVSTVDPSNALDEGGGGAENNNTTAVKVHIGSEIVWLDDRLPEGVITSASAGDSWNWITANPDPFSGQLSHQSALKAGLHQHFFYNAAETFPVSTNNTLFGHVFLDPANPPAELMLQWADSTNWEHRAYWGTNKISFGTDGTASRRFMGPLPEAGKWVRLEVPASQVDLEGHTLTGMYFSLYGGRAAWDYFGVRVAPPAPAPVDGTPPTSTATASVAPLVATYTNSAFGIQIGLVNGTTQVKPESIKLIFDGAIVSPSITQAGAMTRIDYIPPTLLASGSSHTVRLDLQDSASQSVFQTHPLNFVVPEYGLVAPESAASSDKVDQTKPGFKIRPYQTAANNPDNLSWTEEQLAGLKGPNLAKLSGADANGFYDWESVINFDLATSGSGGGFSAPSPFPGLPGTGPRDAGTGNAALEILTFLEFPEPGLYVMGVSSDDGFRLTTGVNAADKFSVTLDEFDGARHAEENQFNVLVPKPGIYPFRLIWESSSGSASLRWFTVHEGRRILINDTNAPNFIKAYREGATRAYVKSMSPLPNAIDVSATNSVAITLADGTSRARKDSLQLFLNGERVAPTVSQADGLTIVSYTPSQRFLPESTNTVRLVFADDASPSNVTTNEARFVVTPDVQVLIGVNQSQVWRFNESGTDPGAAWKEINFDDSSWKSGNALFEGKKGTLSALPEPIRATLTISTNVATYYFRTHFNFTGAPGAARLRLRSIIDDGAVFYLNGAEVHRVGMPEGLIQTSSLASRAIDDAEYEGPVEISTRALTPGDNVLAVEVHQSSRTSSDVTMAAELVSITSNPIQTSVDSISPVPDAVEVPRDTAIEVVLRDGAQKVQVASVQLSVNGDAVAPTVRKQADSEWTTISFRPAQLLPGNSKINVRLIYQDDATPAHVTATDFRFTTAPDLKVILAIDDKQLWRYDDSGKDLGAAWKEKNFDDSSWKSGTALFEGKKGTVPALPEPVRTSLTLDATRTNFYFRAHFHFEGDLASARMKIKPIVDDGAVFYLNGWEIFRLGMPADSIDAATLASRTVLEAAYEGPFEVPVTSLVAGDNVLAVEVHQSSASSSDVTMGVQLLVPGSETAPPKPPQSLKVGILQGAKLQLEWSGSGQLQSADSVIGPWTEVTNASNPFTTPITGGAKFYRLKE